MKNRCNNFYKYRPAYEAGMKRKLSSSSPPTLSSPASAFLTPVSPALPQKRQKQPPKMILGVEAQDIPFITQSFNRHRLLALAFSKSANSLSINHCHELHCIHVLWGWIEVCFCHILVSDSSDRRDFVTESVSSPDTLDTPDTPWVCPPPD